MNGSLLDTYLAIVRITQRMLLQQLAQPAACRCRASGG